MESLFKFVGLNRDNPKYIYPVNLNNKNYTFKVFWDVLCDCAFIIIYDGNNELVLGATALVNNLRIKVDQRILPGYFEFKQINGENYEPELNNIAEEFYLRYVNE